MTTWPRGPGRTQRGRTRLHRRHCRPTRHRACDRCRATSGDARVQLLEQALPPRGPGSPRSPRKGLSLYSLLGGERTRGRGRESPFRASSRLCSGSAKQVCADRPSEAASGRVPPRSSRGRVPELGASRPRDPEHERRATRDRAEPRPRRGLPPHRTASLDVHYGRAGQILNERERTLRLARNRHPERIVNGPLKPQPLPQELWTNPPAAAATERPAQ